MKLLLQSASVAVLTLALSGCVTPVPQGLQKANTPSNFTGPVVAGADVWPKANWWTAFGSDEMSDLIVQAQANNLDLAAAAARVEQAESGVEIARAPLFPTIEGSASATRSRSPAGTLGPKAVTGNTFQVGGQASYEVDIFGANWNKLSAANQTLLESRYGQEVVALSTTATVAQTYLAVLAARERIAVANQNIEAAKRILTITKAKVDNGVSSRLDLVQQEAQLAGQEAQIPALEQTERSTLFALAVLLGKMPEDFNVKGQDLDSLKAPVVAPGLPSELLLRRLDVAQAEAALASAHGDVDAARANFFPMITLTGSGGYASNMIKHLINPGDLAWDVGASLLQTIFDGGLKGGELGLAEGQEKELLADYRKAVLSSFSDVETSLNSVANLAKEEDYLTQEVNAASEAFRISEIQYREGVADLLAVLQAQQVLFTAQDELIQIKLARIQADVGLYKALGGGWTESMDDVTQKIPAETTAVAASAAAPEAESKPEQPVPATPGPSDIEQGDIPASPQPTPKHE